MTEELAVSPWDETQQGDSARAGEPPVLVCETTTEGEESMKGIITEIERFALKDGPGIRTTVFFKGCNMACKWCHNPETLSVRPQLMIYPDKCIGCGACVEACRAGARTLGKNGALQYDRTACKHCGACAANCFSGALVMSGKEMTVEEVMEEILQDRAYYRNSGGGVTLSGGEVSTQPGFALELLQALKKEGISTAIETNLHAPWSVYERMLPFLDLVMFDIKIFVETDADVRILRRALRDVEERGRTLQSVVSQYLTTVKPMHEQYVEPSRKYADIVVLEGGHNLVALDMIMQRIQHHIDGK